MSEALRILVIDDDPVMRELLEAVLGFAGHAVATVDSGEGAVARLQQAAEEVDVVLSDLHMPGLQGHELATRLVEMRTPGTLLVGMSGSYPTEAETHLLDYFLQKPFTPEQFDEAVRVARERQSGRGDGRASSDAAPARAVSGVLNEDVYARLAATVPAKQLRELYALTLDDVAGRLARMQRSLAAGDLDAVRREAHAIKGGCGMVGATELYTLASTTEGSTAPGTMPLADFAPACERLKRMLDDRLSSVE